MDKDDALDVDAKGLKNVGNRKLMEDLDDATVVVEAILSLALMSPGHMASDLRDFFRDMTSQEIEGILGIPLDAFADECINEEDWDGMIEWLVRNELFGFVVEFSTPVMTPSGGGRTYSWGFTTHQWIYAPTVEEAVAKAVEWAKQQREKEDKKAKKAAKPQDQKEK